MLTPGANKALSSRSFSIRIALPSGADIDVTILALRGNGKVSGDQDMCFFNQTEIHSGAILLPNTAGNVKIATFDLAKLPAGVEKVVLTAAIDGTAAFGALGDVVMTLDDQTRIEVPNAGRTEKALILAELYLRSGEWKIRNVSQGFNGGLKALSEHFGIEVAEDSPAPVASSRVSLEKRLVELAKKDPELVSLVKKIGVSLEKKGKVSDRAKVCLCLDISASMTTLYRSGKIDTLVKRILALGLRFDDDGEIDVFLFGQRVHEYGAVNVDNYRGFSSGLLKKYTLEGGTRYGDAMERIRAFYARNNAEKLPVYVMFVTDGGTDDKAKTRKMLKDGSGEPLFWKFIGLIDGGIYGNSRSSFLQDLDDLPGRVVDNADYFNVTNPADPDDGKFFDSLMNEYPQWQDATRKLGIIC